MQDRFELMQSELCQLTSAVSKNTDAIDQLKCMLTKKRSKKVSWYKISVYNVTLMGTMCVLQVEASDCAELGTLEHSDTKPHDSLQVICGNPQTECQCAVSLPGSRIDFDKFLQLYM